MCGWLSFAAMRISGRISSPPPIRFINLTVSALPTIVRLTLRSDLGIEIIDHPDIRFPFNHRTEKHVGVCRHRHHPFMHARYGQLDHLSHITASPRNGREGARPRVKNPDPAVLVLLPILILTSAVILVFRYRHWLSASSSF